MTTMIAEVYDALLSAGSPEDKARKRPKQSPHMKTVLPKSRVI
jgi:hypothetical protein